MKLASLTNWILILCSGFLAMAFDHDNDDDFYFALNTYQTFSPGDEVKVNINGRFMRRTDVDFSLYRIADPIDFFREQPNPHSPGTKYDDEGNVINIINLKNKKRYKKLDSWSERITSKRYWANQTVTVPVQNKGVYLVVAHAREKVATTIVIVTDAGLILKRSDDQVLGYALNRKNGRKAPNTQMIFRNGSVQSEVRANNDGVGTIPMSSMIEPEDEESDEEFGFGWYGGSNFVVFGETDGNFFISDSYYYRHWSGGADGLHKTYLHTDRSVYRPAQEVFYRGIVRKVNDDGTYTLPKTKKVEVQISDARGGELVKDTLDISDFGTFHGNLSLADEPPLGDYHIQVMIEGSAAGYFTFAVEEYKKPEYEVRVTTPKTSYTRGDKVTSTLQADYYFGSPVAEGTVEYRIMRSRYYRPWWAGSQWAYLYRGMPTYNPYGSEFVDNGRGKLNADGSFTFDFDTPEELDGDYNYTLVANVTDASRRTISGSATIRVTRGAFFLTARTDQYVYQPGDPVALHVGAWEFDGDKGVSTSFDVKVKRTWWERKRYEEEIWTGSGRTKADGSGVITFDAPKAGYLTAEITATDDRGNTIQTSASIYVADEDYAWWDNSSNSVQIIPDRDLYKPGEIMSALVIMPVEGSDMLITAEGPTIFDYQVERLGGNSAVIRIPIEENYAPTFFLSAATLVGDRMYSTQQQITVAPEGKLITLEITTDKEEYKPGEKATVTVRTLNHEGEPVPNVDVALGMVDEAVYAIRPDNTPEIETFFYGQRWNKVNTSSSLDFRFYNVAKEEAEADGLMAVADMEESTVVGRAAPMMANAEKQSLDYFDAGDDLSSEALVAPALRKDFRDLMFWTHSVRTQGNGYATMTVEFPDNLTTWRITARGVTQATEVGQATAEVIARKNLLVRMETPRFLTQGDELVIATNVHNYLSTPKRVKVEFKAEGVNQERSSRSVTIAPNAEERIDWKIEAEDIGTATFTVKALTNEESDAMELKIPVLPQGVKTGMSRIADIAEPNGRREMSLIIPGNGKLETGELYVSLSPSAASSMLGALDDLIGYPYGCVEQTMSRFLPTVVVADVLEDLHVPFDQKKREEMPKMVDKGLKRLYTLQHGDGGWGWWENDDTNPFMTAYVMYGLTVAKEAGYQISDERYTQGLSQLYDLIESRIAGGGLSQDEKRLNATTEAYMLYVASIADSKNQNNGMVRERISNLADEEKINNYAIALLALAAHEQGDTRNAKSLAGRLIANVKETAGSAFWSGSAWHYNWQDDQVETSAAAVKALLKIEGETELVGRGVRWLLAQKNGASWHNTRQTAMVIYSLVDYLRTSNELDPDYTMVVKVNGKEMLRKQVTKDHVFMPEQVVKVTADNLRKGENVVTVEKSGAGRLYASARLIYFATGDAIKPGEAGFNVEREYYKLNRVKKRDRYVYKKEKITEPLKSGDEIFVKLKVTPESKYEYFLMEDLLPAGCEVITDTEGYTIINEKDYQSDDDNYYYRRWNWNWWYADRDVRDEKVAFFATSIDARTYELSYIMRAQIPGDYSVMPAVASLMYYPEVRGNSGTERISIVD